MKPRRLLSMAATACGIFLVVAWIGAYASGWSELAGRFPHSGSPPALLLSTNRIVLSRHGGTPFTLKGIVRIAVSPQGLYLAQSGPFRLFASPILIPWSAVTSYARNTWDAGVSDTSVTTSIGLEVSIPDPGDAVFTECRRQHIPEEKAP